MRQLSTPVSGCNRTRAPSEQRAADGQWRALSDKRAAVIDPFEDHDLAGIVAEADRLPGDVRSAEGGCRQARLGRRTRADGGRARSIDSPAPPARAAIMAMVGASLPIIPPALPFEEPERTAVMSVRASRRALRALLSTREDSQRIKEGPHPEEAAERPSRRVPRASRTVDAVRICGRMTGSPLPS
jgi:hypothetical protein